MKKSFVTGGTGFIGAHVVRKLVERGDDVTVLVRPWSNRSLIADLPVRFAIGDITDAETLETAIKGMDVIYHIAADYRLWSRDPSEIYRSNVQGTHNVLEVSFRVGVEKVVYTSTVGCLGLPADGSEGNEQTPVTRNELVGHYKKSKYDAEQIAVDYAARGLPVVIVNPSTPVGPGDIKPTPTGRIILDFLRGKMKAYVDTGLNLVAVEDVAEGHILASARGRVGEKYILGNRNMTLKELLDVLARMTGLPAPTLRIPHWIAVVAAALDVAAARMLGREPYIPLEGALMARKKMFFSSQKALRELGMPQSSVEDALARAVDWFEKNGYVRLKRRIGSSA
jgi:dihydroflavonol-4-reductase